MMRVQRNQSISDPLMINGHELTKDMWRRWLVHNRSACVGKICDGGMCPAYHWIASHGIDIIAICATEILTTEEEIETPRWLGNDINRIDDAEAPKNGWVTGAEVLALLD